MHTEWQLNDLYGYTGIEDPALEKDAKLIESTCEKFEKKYRADGSYLTDEKALAKAMKEYEKLYVLLDTSKPLRYFHFLTDLDSDNKEALAKKRALDDRLTKSGVKIQFFLLALGKIPAARQKKFIASKELAQYRYFLERLFIEASHTLSEAEEKIMALKDTPARALWVDGVEGVVSRGEVVFGGKHIPLNKALNDIRGVKDVTKRRAYHEATMAKLKTFADFAESEINAVFTNKKVNDELRGYAEPYSATIEGYQNDEKSVLALVDAVTSHFYLSHRFYDIKRKMLGLPYLTYADRSVGVGSTKQTFPFPKAVEIVRETFHNADPKYVAILDSYLERGQIDVMPKKGKTGGAYCAGVYGMPTQILLNHVDDFNSVVTLGHEMGHGIHTERSKATQSALMYGYSTSTAETASTFFEGLTFEHVTKQLSDKERVIALHDSLDRAVSSIMRQVAFFNFELELHRAIREKGWMPAAEIAKLMNKHFASYLGKKVKLAEDDGYSFVYIGHFRRMFYVYSYAYGDLISRALRERVRENPAYIKQVDQFLCAGGSATPEDIFTSIGLDVRSPDLFIAGLKSIERDIDELERLVKKGK